MLCKVSQDATVDELLRKMPGMEVGINGDLKYQGETVSKAKLNGKTFAGGDVTLAIQNLPALNISVFKCFLLNSFSQVAIKNLSNFC